MPLLCRRWNSLLLSGGSLLSVLSALAAPDNDGFASARVLPAFLPATAVGGNVAASNETGEPRPEKSARTVWWNWTPSSSGWVRITTQGADIDTVLAAYTGSSLAGLNRQALNDDVGAAEGEVGPSELVLRVTAGETYRIQVGGYAGWEGAFSLRLQTAATPPQLTALSFTPATVDVSSQPSAATFDVA